MLRLPGRLGFYRDVHSEPVVHVRRVVYTPMHILTTCSSVFCYSGILVRSFLPNELIDSKMNKPGTVKSYS